MNATAAVADALRFIRSRTDVSPRVGIVLGSGLAPLVRRLEAAISIPLAEIPHFPVGAVEGHAQSLALARWAGVPVAVLAGRAHVYEGFSAAEVALPVRTLIRLGAQVLILTNAAGAVNVNYRPGELLLVEDHLNLTGANPLTGPHEEGLGPRFPDLTEAYDPRLRELAEKVCWKAGVAVRKGVYAAFAGPSYETPAEIRMARTLGADVVGMSTVHEVIAARQMGARVLALACIANKAAGVTRQPLSHAEVLAAAAQVREAVADVLERLLPALASEP